MSLEYNRAIYPVEGSEKKDTVTIDGKQYDRHTMQYDEYIWIINPKGERTVSDEEFFYQMKVNSSADIAASYSNAKNKGYKLVRTVANGTSTTMFSQRVTAEWIWGNHPDPVKFTDVPALKFTASGKKNYGAELPTSGGTVQVKAEGLLPSYYLEGAPEGVKINKNTGLITVPAGLAPGDYKFKISAVQEYRGTKIEYQSYERVGEFFQYVPREALDSVYYGHDPVPADTREFTLVIKGEAPKPEPPVIKFNDTKYSILQGGGFQTEYTLTGTEPIMVAVAAKNARGGAVLGFTVDTSGRLVSAPNNLAAGTYTVTATAKNSAGESSASFTLTVERTGTAPAFVKETHNYAFIFNVSTDTVKDYQIKATGSAPITYSLEASGSHALPAFISINPNTGVVKVTAGFSELGTHYFTIRAVNDFGSATQGCTLTVDRLGMNPTGFSGGSAAPAIMLLSASTGNPSLSGMNSTVLAAEKPVATSVLAEGITVTHAEFDRSLKGRAKTQLTAVETERKLLYMESQISKNPNIINPSALMPEPLNKVTITWKDAKDIYTNDRNLINGAEYIFWDSEVSVIPSQEPVTSPTFAGYLYEKWQLKGVSDVLKDSVPSSNKYHPIYEKYVRPEVPTTSKVSLKDAVVNTEGLKESTNTMISGSKINGLSGKNSAMEQWMQNSGLDELELSDPVVEANRNAEAGSVTYKYLHFGPQLVEMAEQKTGLYTVALDDSTGAAVSGEYFTTLKGNKDLSLAFEQKGAAITFNGKDIKGDILDSTLLDLKYTPLSRMEDEMLAAAKTEGGKNFTYSFGHHGELPGMATFDVTTDMTEGETVNVYRYEPDAGKFTLIAGDLKVGTGGSVRYRNNTMSDYLITTNRIDGALTQSNGAGNNWLLYAGIISVLMLVAAGTVVFIILKKKKRAIQKEG